MTAIQAYRKPQNTDFGAGSRRGTTLPELTPRTKRFRRKSGEGNR
jgi:hypothetical protein